MESPATSYSVYPPGNTNPSRPPMRRSAPEEARSGFPFLIAMAGLVLAVAVGAVARFCPQDLRFDGGKTHATTAAATPPVTPSIDPPVAPSPASFTTITSAADESPAPAVTVASAKKSTRRRSGLPSTRGSTSPSANASASASAAASAAAIIPDNPYATPATPDTYGF